MALSHLRRWLHARRRDPTPTTDSWRGNEFGWALREISGDARHPNHPTTPPHQKHPTSPDEKPATP